MDKTIYVYLAIFVVLYGLYRINSTEHFTDNTSGYINSQHLRQYELGKFQLLKAQQKEIEIKRKVIEAQIEEEKLRKQKMELELIKRKEETEGFLKIKNKLINEELKMKEDNLEKEQKLKQLQLQIQIQKEINENNKLETEKRILIEKTIEEQKKIEKQIIEEQKRIEKEQIEENKKLRSDYIKPYIEKFNQITEKIYEYMVPSVSIFNTAKTCGFSYDLVDGSNTLTKGQMFMNNDKSKLTFHYADKTGYTGINIPLSQSKLFMKDGVSKYQLSISEFNSNSDKGEFVVTINLSGIPDKFFNKTTTYIINECDDNDIVNNVIMENQLWNSFLVFISLVTIALLIINYKTVIEVFNYYFLNKADSDNKITGGKHIFYIGGYDYRDYSD
jgi:hypothetical protein